MEAKFSAAITFEMYIMLQRSMCNAAKIQES